MYPTTTRADPDIFPKACDTSISGSGGHPAGICERQDALMNHDHGISLDIIKDA